MDHRLVGPWAKRCSDQWRGYRVDWMGPYGLSPDTREQGLWHFRANPSSVWALWVKREVVTQAFQSGCRGRQGTLKRNGRGGEGQQVAVD